MNQALEANPVKTGTAASAQDSRTKTLLMALRQALIIALGALEDYLGMERSIMPKHKR